MLFDQPPSSDDHGNQIVIDYYLPRDPLLWLLFVKRFAVITIRQEILFFDYYPSKDSH